MIEFLFGTSSELSSLQMVARGIGIFFVALVLVRIAGRRTFGMRAPFDNILVILLGAILGRVVVGASPFIPTFSACFVICVLHRLLAYISLKHPFMERVFKGTRRNLYSQEKFHSKDMNYSLVNEDDMMEEVRLKAHVDSLDQVQAIYMEKNGEISTVKK